MLAKRGGKTGRCGIEPGELLHYGGCRLGGRDSVRQAENNEPLRVRHLFRRWLTRQGVRVIVNLKQLEQFGIWEVGVLTSFKRQVDQRVGVLRLCNLDPALQGYFNHDRFSECFEIYNDLEAAMAGR